MACLSTLSPSNGVRTHRLVTLLAFLRTGRQPTRSSRYQLAASSIPRSLHPSDSEHGDQNQLPRLHRRKRPSSRETWGMFCVLASLVPKPSQAQGRISTSCSPCAAHHLSPASRVLACNPRHPIGLHRSGSRFDIDTPRAALPRILHACHSAGGLFLVIFVLLGRQRRSAHS